jgi:RNA polymerase subunit RPABC4/transcription elongation factor Spt4
MHRLHGFGHHCRGGWGGGWGWFIPALILGELISNRTPRQPEWPYPPPAPNAREPQRQTAEAATQTKATILCQKCNQRVNPEFDFCPHCGTRLAPRTCGYCGQTLERGATYCTKCGGPVRP